MVGDRIIEVEHLGERLPFYLPLIGPGRHEDIMNGVTTQEFLRPTTAQMFSLVDAALQDEMNGGENPYFEGVLDAMREKYVWTATRSLLGSDGLFVYDDVSGSMPKTRDGLIKFLENESGKVRLINPNFKPGCLTLAEFMEHPYLVAQVGEEMLPTVERVAKQIFNENAYLFGRTLGGEGRGDFFDGNEALENLTSLNFFANDFVLNGCHVATDAEGFACGVYDNGD